MTWQGELWRLDADLAAGRLDHDRHRRLREEILAVESGFPVSERPEAHWRATNPASVPANRGQALLAAGRPTTAPSPADERSTDSMPHPVGPPPAAAELTTPLARVPPGTPPHYPPLPPASPQRPGRNRGSKPTWLFLALGVLLVLVLVIGGAWWLGQGGDKRTGTPGTASPAAPSPVALEARLPELPGTPSPDNSTMSVAKGVELGLYPQELAQIFTKHGAQRVIYRASTHDVTAYFMLLLPTESPREARMLAQEMRQVALRSGFSRAVSDDRTLTGDLGDRTLAGTWYSSGSNVVNVWVSRPSTQVDGLTRLWNETIAAFRRVLPPA